MMRKRAIYRAVLILSAFALALSCSTAPSGAPEKSVDYSTLKREELDSLATKDQEACIEAISSIAASGGFSAELDRDYLAQAASTAARSLAARYGTELSGGAWKDAERSEASLEALASSGQEILAGAARIAAEAKRPDDRERILLGRAADYWKRGLYAPGAAYADKALDAVEKRGARSADLTGQRAGEFSAWLDRAVAAKDEVTARRMRAFLGKDPGAGSAATDAAANGAAATGAAATVAGSSGSTMADMAGGVVTVYVDKGLKIANGVGYPDRVLGTAFQVDPRGYYLTNYHVITSEVDPKYNGYSKLSIRPQNNPDARIPAKVIGWNKALDLAVISSQETAPRSFYPFRTDKAAKGQKVYAVGSPVGLENSVSAGIVSATGRRILPRGEAIQIDVPVNPGNSGGPLLDESGNLVGVVFAGLTGYQGLNFALPAAWVSAIFPSLFDEGEAETSWLGIGLAKNLDASLDLCYVYPGKSGFEAGDALAAIDGKRAEDIQGAQMILATKPVGSLCSVAIVRNGQKVELLRKTEPAPDMPFKKAAKRDLAERLLAGATGMLIEQVSGPQGSGGTYKVLKAWPGMAADESGIRENDVLTLVRYSVDGRKDSLYFDVSAKSTSAGYLERTMRINLPLEMDNFL